MTNITQTPIVLLYLILHTVVGGLGYTVQTFKGCAPGWLAYKDSCFLIVGGTYTQEDARVTCKGRGGELATIDSYTAAVMLKIIRAKCIDQSDSLCSRYTDHTACYLKNSEVFSSVCPFSCGLCGNLCSDNATTCFHDTFWIGQANDGDYCHQLSLTKNKAVRYWGCKTGYEVNTSGFICEAAVQIYPNIAVLDFQRGCPVNSLGYGSMCYVLNVAERNWTEAQRDCRMHGGELASIPDRSMLELVNRELLSVFSEVWLGLSRTYCKKGDLYTWADGRHVTYLPWQPIYTGNEEGACVNVNSGENSTLSRLATAQCNRKLPSLCQVYRDSRQTGSDVITPLIANVRVGCKETWTSFNGTFCYKMINELKSWQGAQEHCNTLDGELLSVHSPQEDEAVRSHITRREPTFHDVGVWTGLRKPGEEHAFEWSDGSAFDFSAWGIGQPKLNTSTGSREFCVKLQYKVRTWQVAECKEKLLFVCRTSTTALSTKSTTSITQTATVSSDILTASWKIRSLNLESGITKTTNVRKDTDHADISQETTENLPRGTTPQVPISDPVASTTAMTIRATVGIVCACLALAISLIFIFTLSCQSQCEAGQSPGRREGNSPQIRRPQRGTHQQAGQSNIASVSL